MDTCYRNNRSPILVRKVLTGGGRKVRGGIYDEYGIPIKEIVPGERYRARIQGKFVRVVAQPNQTMHLELQEDPLKEESDPRVRATLADARAAGFDLTRGDYVRD